MALQLLAIKKVQHSVPLILSILFTIISFFCLSISQAQEVIVVDGDTIKIDGEKIRFSGIDAPELNQTCLKNDLEKACGKLSQILLKNKVEDQEVNCIREGKDQYGRTLAECFVDKISISSFMVREGYAFAYRKYSKKFIEDEEYAKINNNGMWATEFIFPWNFRRLK